MAKRQSFNRLHLTTASRRKFAHAPHYAQGSINMNHVFMFFALLVGARVAGLVGVFLSIPIAGVLISLFDLKEMQGES